MFKTIPIFAVLAGQLLAGGFYLQLGNPSANPQARNMNAVLVVKATGCHDPGSAHLTATAISPQGPAIPLKVTRLSEPGVFAISQEWPDSGNWVIRIEGRNGEQFTNTLVKAGPKGVDRLHAKFSTTAFGAKDVEAMLD